MRKFVGSQECCNCGAPCDHTCPCSLGYGFTRLKMPDTLTLSDLFLNTGQYLQYRTAQSPTVCAGPYNTFGFATECQLGYTSLSDVVLNKVAPDSTTWSPNTDVTGNCAYAADVDIATASNWSEVFPVDSRFVWGNNTNLFPSGYQYGGAGSSVGGTSGADGCGYSGIRRIEVMFDLGVASGMPTIRFLAKELWVPKVTTAWYNEYLNYYGCVTGWDATRCHAGCTSLKPWWDGSSYDAIAHDSPYALDDENKLAYGPEFIFSAPYASIPVATSTLNDFATPRLGVDASYYDATPASKDIYTSPADPCNQYCDFVTTQFSQKQSATLEMNVGEICGGLTIHTCFFNENGAGCNPFNRSGTMTNASPLNNFTMTLDGDTWTQTADAYWDTFQLVVPATNGTHNSDIAFREVANFIPPSHGFNEEGRKWRMSIQYLSGFFYTTVYDGPIILSKCSGNLTFISADRPSMSGGFTLPYGDDCPECDLVAPEYGCCELLNGTTQITQGEAACTVLGGNYLGDNTNCDPTGCCELYGASDLNKVTESHCTIEGGTWTENTDCPFDPCAESWTMAVNSYTISLEMDDPNFDLTDPFNISQFFFAQGTSSSDHDVCSTSGAKVKATSGELRGDHTNNPTNIAYLVPNVTAKYDQGPKTWTFQFYLEWTHSGTTYTITASKSGVSIPSAGCPSILTVQSFDTFTGNYTQTGNGITFTVNDLVGSARIELTCE